MIIAEWEGATIVVSEVGEPEPTVSDPVVLRVVERMLEAPAPVQTAEHLEDGTIVEQTIPLKPGQPGHVRAALRRLAGIEILADDGADLEDV